MASNQYIIFQNVKKTTQQNTRNKNIKQSPTMVQINVDIYEKQSKRKKNGTKHHASNKSEIGNRDRYNNIETEK